MLKSLKREARRSRKLRSNTVSRTRSDQTDYTPEESEQFRRFAAEHVAKPKALHSSDLLSAITYMDKYHPKFEGV